jgi:hypothetical protein
MSRRHHGRPHQRAHGVPDGQRRVTGVSPVDGSPAAPRPAARAVPAPPSAGSPVQPSAPVPEPTPRPDAGKEAPAPAFVPPAEARPDPVRGAPTHSAPINGGATPNGQCTAPQLRRFIKSRPYVPMHELRRRFGIDGGDDDVTPVRLDPGWVYVGLPTREGGLLGELLKAGEIGYELSLDPRSPIVIGVYPMRPIPRG